jgi:WD40 repeat protein
MSNPLDPSGPSDFISGSGPLVPSASKIHQVGPSSAKPDNPYPGLRPFDEDDSAFFFGRVQHVSDLLARLTRNRFLAVVGVSGSGKSSLVRAGLIPVLRQGFLSSAGERWRTVLLRPGKAPVKALASALDSTFGTSCNAKEVLEDSCGGVLEIANRFLDLRENLLVVVDQFEEIFRYKHLTQNERSSERINAVAEASAFVSLILNALDDDRFHAVITMRSEYLGDCAQFQGLPEQINKGQYLIPRLTPEQQREIIVRPVWARSAKISELLVQRLLDEVGPEPEQLPVLQHALSQVWRDWEREGSEGALGLVNLEHLGGLDKAMDGHAEEVYRNLPSSLHQWVAKRLFQRITLKGTSEHPVRRAETISDIRSVINDIPVDSNPDRVLLDVIETMREESVGFLTSPESGTLKPGSVIDISHESLCWLWTRLKGWVEQEAESADLYSRVSKLAFLYNDNKKQQGLYTDPGLTYVLKTYRPAERSVLDPDKVDPWSQAWSLAYNKSWKVTKEYLEDSQFRQRIKTFGKAGLVALVAICTALIIAAFLITEGKRADDYASQADFQRAQLGALTQERAALLDIKSRQIQGRPSNSDLASWESFDRIVQGTPIGGELKFWVNRLFVLGDHHVIAVMEDPPHWEHVPSPIVFKSDGQIQDVGFTNRLKAITAISPSGRYVATPCEESKLVLWDRIDDRQLFTAKCSNSLALILESSGDSKSSLKHFVTVENLDKNKATIRVLDADGNGTPIHSWEGVPLMNEVISSDGKYIAVATHGPHGAEVELRMLSSPQQQSTVIRSVSDYAPLAFTSDAHFLAIGMQDGHILLCDLRKGQLGTRQILNISRRSEVKIFPISALAFSHNAQPQLLAYAEDGYQNVLRVVKLHEVNDEIRGEFLWSDYFGRRIGELIFSPHDAYLGLALDENTARVKVAATGFETARVTHTGRALSIAFSENEQLAFSGSDTHQLLRFPTEATKSPELVEFGCSQPQEVSVGRNGAIAAVSCAIVAPPSVTPVVQIFKTDPSSKQSVVVPPSQILAGEPFLAKDRGYLCHTSVSASGDLVAAQCNEKIVVVDPNSGDRWIVPGDFGAGSAALIDSNDCQKIPLSLVLNQTGSLLAVGDDCGRVLIYDFDRSKGVESHSGSERSFSALKIQKLLSQQAPAGSKPSEILGLPPKAWAITALSFSYDSKTLAVGTANGILWVENVSNSSNGIWAKQLDGAIGAIQFSRDSQNLMVAAGGAASILSANEGRNVRYVSEPDDTFTAVSFASDGKRAAAGTLKGKVKLLDLSTPGLPKIAERLEAGLLNASPAADATLSGLDNIYALQFYEPNGKTVLTPQSSILAIWATRDQVLAPADQGERDRSLALSHHDFDIDRHAAETCTRLNPDLVVPPDLKFASVCGGKKN